MSLHRPEAWREMPWLDSVFLPRRYFDEAAWPVIVVLLENWVSISCLHRLLAALAFREPGNLKAFELLGSQERTPGYPPSTNHSNVMFLEPSMLWLWGVK